MLRDGARSGDLMKPGRPGTLPRWFGHGVAVVLTVAVTLLAHELEPVWDATGRHPYLIEWPRIFAAAWLGGLGLVHLIRDLVDASALDGTGSLSLVFAEEEIASFVGEAVANATLQAASKAIAISAEVSPDLRVRCDRDRMLQVLGNLLANAVRFTLEGGRITVRAVRLDPFVRMGVTDTGPGIRREHQQAVFERHWSGGTVCGGAGLGLFIARGIVRGHGGRLWLHSEPGHGTPFLLTLPAVAPAWRGQRAASSERFRFS